MKFKITLEHTPPPGHPEDKAETKEVVVDAPSCCEACVAAMKSTSGFSFTKWEKLDENPGKEPA